MNYVSIFTAIILLIIIIVLLIELSKQLSKVKALERNDAKYRDLKITHEELKDSYDVIINKYYTLHEESIDLEKRIDEYEDKLLDDQIKKSLAGN